MIDRTMTWMERKNFVSVHAMTLYLTLWMTWEAFQWAAMFSLSTRLDGIGTAAVIAAVTAPISALQIFVFNTYSQSRK